MTDVDTDAVAAATLAAAFLDEEDQEVLLKG